MTKSLEGNTTLKEGGGKPSHGALWEILPVLEKLLQHFESLEQQAKRGDFNDNPRIQSLITLAWGKTKDYYKKTDASIAWMAAVVLHPRFKWAYFDRTWTGNEASFVRAGKTKLKRLWDKTYKDESIALVPERSPSPPLEHDYLQEMLDQIAPVEAPIRSSTRRDQLVQYLEEPPTQGLSPLQYWRERESRWPQLAAMAFDFLAIPAMSSECERVFSSCAKLTTAESSRLSGILLWYQECLSN